MKTSQTFGLSLLMVAIIVVPFSGKASAKEGSSENTPIIIRQDPTNVNGAPRMPVFNPFFAELLSGYVLLGSTSPYGTVDVDITSTAGDSYSTSFDTLDGAIVLPVSGDSGFYSLRITTAAGVQFVGEFTI